MHGAVHWTELMTSDVEKAKAFYGDIMGWTITSMPMQDGEYWLFSRSGADLPEGGMLQWTGSSEDAPTDYWFTYFAVDDVDAAIAKATEKGGTILRPPFDIAGVGRIAIVRDTTGAVSGWMTPATVG